MNAMNRLADSAETPEFDAPRIERRTRRRRTAGIATVAAALIAAGGGTALATSVASNSSSTPASSTSSPAATAATGSDATTLLYTFADGTHTRMEVGGYDLQMARAVLEKTQTKLGSVTKKAVENCKPGSVVEVSPHAPTAIRPGDTINIVLCAG